MLKEGNNVRLEYFHPLMKWLSISLLMNMLWSDIEPTKYLNDSCICMLWVFYANFASRLKCYALYPLALRIIVVDKTFIS